jgi:ribosomal protein L37AE/L43A
MAPTRHRNAPYWVHSQVDDDTPPVNATPMLDAYLKMVKAACPGGCNRPFWRVHKAALSELTMAHATHAEPYPYQPDVDVVDRAVTLLVPASPRWCRACQDDIKTAVQQLPSLAWTCRQMPDGKLAPAPPSEVRVQAIAPPSPSPAYNAWEEIAHWLADWAGEVADLVGARRPYVRDRIGALQLLAGVYTRFLVGHWSAVMSCEDAVRFGNEAFDLVKKAEVAAGIDQVEHHLPVPCPACDRKALSRRDGSETVLCKACKTKWAWEDYERLGVIYRDSLRGSLQAHPRRVLGRSMAGYGGRAGSVETDHDDDLVGLRTAAQVELDRQAASRRQAEGKSA